MITLGINYSQMRDLSACLVRDRELLFAVAEERIIGRSMTRGFRRTRFGPVWILCTLRRGSWTWFVLAGRWLGQRFGMIISAAERIALATSSLFCSLTVSSILTASCSKPLACCQRAFR